MADHVSADCRACCFQLRQLRVVLQSLTSEAATSLVHTFVSCRLDYRTVMPCYIASQIVNFSKCIFSRTLLWGWLLACGEWSASLRSWNLCRLLIMQRMTYKLATLVHNSTNALMMALQSTWQSSVIQASTDIKEWDQLMVGSSMYHARSLHLVTCRSPSLIHAPGTTYLILSETHLCHSQHSQNC